MRAPNCAMITQPPSSLPLFATHGRALTADPAFTVYVVIPAPGGGSSSVT